MNTSQLNRALILLVGLSLGTTLLAKFVPNAGFAFVAIVLVFSGLKARVILMDYLCLSQTPSFRGGFTAFLVGFLSVAMHILLHRLPRHSLHASRQLKRNLQPFLLLPRQDILL